MENCFIYGSPWCVLYYPWANDFNFYTPMENKVLLNSYETNKNNDNK